MSSSDLVIPATPSLSAPAESARASAAPRYLFGPWIDFLCLGGASFVLLPFIALLPEESNRASLAAGMLLLANLINHPHFAHSYQIFYRGFGRKAFAAEGDPNLRARYLLAGLVVPVLLAMFFAVCLWRGDARMLGYAGNLMALLVGWHYVKQGYGMLMVDAALKRLYFPARDKVFLLANGYAVWATAWIWANQQANERDLWGLKYYSFDLPDGLLPAVGAAAAVSGGLAIFVLVRRWFANGGALPINGTMAYLVTLYGWTLFAKLSPLWLLVVPALHSLQYMIVVYRFQGNYEKARTRADSAANPPGTPGIVAGSYARKMVWFALVGLALGFIGFFGAPVMMHRLVEIDREIFGPTIFLFVFWIFINVHHYFIDSVMWRRENPEARRFLFS